MDTRLRYHNILMISLFSLILTSCGDSTDGEPQEVYNINEGKLVYKLYENDTLIEESIMTLDSVREGKSVYYYPNGKIRRVNYLKKGLKDSVEIEYYKSGDIKYQRIYVKGRPWGESYHYYDSLRDIYFTERDNDTIRVEEQLAKEYIFYDLDGNPSYRREYDSIGNLLLQEGESIVETRIFNDTIQIGDTLKTQFYTVNPPWVMKDFRVRILRSEDVIYDDKARFNPKYSTVFFNHPFNEAGTYRIVAILTLSDKLNSEVKQDTVRREIIVRNEEPQS